jgi:hypothetical protein
MSGWRTFPRLMLGLVFAAAPSLLTPGAAPVLALNPDSPLSPAPSNEEEERTSSTTEAAGACDLARRSIERHRSGDRRLVVHPLRRHHAAAVLPATPPAPFPATVNPPLHC